MVDQVSRIVCFIQEPLTSSASFWRRGTAIPFTADDRQRPQSSTIKSEREARSLSLFVGISCVSVCVAWMFVWPGWSSQASQSQSQSVTCAVTLFAPVASSSRVSQRDSLL
jgi:hypothetical protein